MQLTGTAAAPAARSQRSWALVLTSVAFFMTALDSLVVVTALPAIHAGLGGSVATLEWTVNAYTLPFAAGIITAAALGDRLGQAANVCHRSRPVHARLGSVRARTERQRPDRRARGAGPRRSAGHAAEPDHPRGRVPA